MVLDGRALARGCAAQGTELRTAEHLCRTQLDRFRAALAEGRPITVGCTQEAPLFTEEGEDAALTFVNLRETAGWSSEGAAAGPKMAGLLAAAAVPLPAVPLVPMKSEGVALVLGRDAVALEVAKRLADRLDLTVLLTGAEPVQPLAEAAFPVLRGRARAATGWLGAFQVTVDGYAAPSPASRAEYRWGPSRDGAVSRCDLVLDVSGHAPLFPTHELRQGYLRADPADAAAIERLCFDAANLVGEFDQPRFVAFEPGLCAHSRNKRTGCTRCLDLCPTGAIAPGKDSVVITAEICAGCGACAAVCPTGAVTYALPPPATTLARIRALLLGYAQAGGRDGVLLLHDAEHGAPLIEALARHGDGLPARVLTLAVNSVAQLDLSVFLAALAWGAAGVRVLAKGRRGHGLDGVLRNLDYVAAAVGDTGHAALIESDDPFALPDALRPALELRGIARPAEFLAIGTPREVTRLALRALHTPGAPEVVPMPEKAPFGIARVAAEGCTLCLACTMVCPTSAFSANPERPELRFLEDACVQCGLCAATCPEKVITLEPRLNFAEEAARDAVVKAEEPALCTRCSKPFGTNSSIERVKTKLAAHWMFADPSRRAVFEMCEDCRAIEATLGGIDPYAGPERPLPRTETSS
jgi:ferredoxin